MKIRSVKKYKSKFVRIKYAAKVYDWFITGTIIEVYKDYLVLNVSDEKLKSTLYYDKILRIFELPIVRKTSRTSIQK